MKDLTVIFLTANEVPEEWRKYHRKVLLEAVGDYSLITVSRKPVEGMGKNIIDNYPKSYLNIYRHMLIAAKEATTDYVAVAEDDTLYPKEHFDFFRPEKDTFAYNQNRFALFTWGEAIYSMRNRKSNCSLIAPRELLIEALEERFKKFPGDTMPKEYVGELGREKIDKWLGVTVRKSVEVYSDVSIIQINHEAATEERQKRKRKSLGQVRAYDIPYWGKAEDLRKNFK
jgi:hypothetical protein